MSARFVKDLPIKYRGAIRWIARPWRGSVERCPSVRGDQRSEGWHILTSRLTGGGPVAQPPYRPSARGTDHTRSVPTAWRARPSRQRPCPWPAVESGSPPPPEVPPSPLTSMPAGGLDRTVIETRRARCAAFHSTRPRPNGQNRHG